LKHIKKTVDAQQRDLLLSVVVAFASPQIASSTTETSSKSAKDDDTMGSIEKWMRKKIHKYHCNRQVKILKLRSINLGSPFFRIYYTPNYPINLIIKITFLIIFTPIFFYLKSSIHPIR
jgi:hypothetical protein